MKKRASTVAVIAAASVLWITLDQPGQWSAPPPVESDLTKTYAESMTLWHFDERGQLSSRLTVDEARQPLRKPVTELVGIFIDGRTTDNRRWTTTAREGVLWGGNNRLNLKSEVELQMPGEAVTLRANHLNLDLERKLARSSARVTLTSKSSETTGRGLFADLEQQLIKLHEDVETRYVH